MSRKVGWQIHPKSCTLCCRRWFLSCLHWWPWAGESWKLVIKTAQIRPAALGGDCLHIVSKAAKESVYLKIMCVISSIRKILRSPDPGAIEDGGEKSQCAFRGLSSNHSWRCTPGTPSKGWLGAGGLWWQVLQMAHGACSGACWPTEVFWTSQQTPELPLLLQIMLVPHIKWGSILSCRLITNFCNSVLNCDDVLQCLSTVCVRGLTWILCDL